MRIDRSKLRHSKVSDLGSSPSDHEDVVPCQVSVDGTIGVEVDQSQCYVVADVELNMIGQWCQGAFQEYRQIFIT